MEANRKSTIIWNKACIEEPTWNSQQREIISDRKGKRLIPYTKNKDWSVLNFPGHGHVQGTRQRCTQSLALVVRSFTSRVQEWALHPMSSRGVASLTAEPFHVWQGVETSYVALNSTNDSRKHQPCVALSHDTAPKMSRSIQFYQDSPKRCLEISEFTWKLLWIHLQNNDVMNFLGREQGGEIGMSPWRRSTRSSLPSTPLPSCPFPPLHPFNIGVIAWLIECQLTKEIGLRGDLR